MANPIYDIAAISTNTSGDPATVYTLHTMTATSGALRQAELSNVIHNVLTSAGWTTISSTSLTNGTSYDMHGLQAPWFDEDNVPDWYTQNIPWFKTVNNSATVSRFNVGLYNGTTGTYTLTAPNSYGFAVPGAAEIIHVWANPYQIIVRRTGASLGIVFSVLHVPDFVQERVQVRNCMVAYSGAAFYDRLDDANAYSWLLYDSNLGTAAQFREGGLGNTSRMIVQVGGGANAAIEGGKWVWAGGADPSMGTSSIWHPMLCPPTVCFPLVSNTSTKESYGMFWDSVIVNKQYSFGDKISGLPEVPTSERRDWLVVGRSGAGGDTAYQTSLIAITGASP